MILQDKVKGFYVGVKTDNDNLGAGLLRVITNFVQNNEFKLHLEICQDELKQHVSGFLTGSNVNNNPVSWGVATTWSGVEKQL